MGEKHYGEKIPEQDLEKLNELRVKEDDAFFPKSAEGGYAVDAPDIGFRIYLPSDSVGGWTQEIIVVNTRKFKN
jgi:hypothetical protein